jgi:hypothetical protein
MSRTVVVTLAAGAICALAVPRAHAASGPPTRIEAIEKITSMTGPATGSAGPRQGDSLAYTSTMSDRLGRHLGSGAGQCMVIAVRAGKISHLECNGSYSLPGGYLMLTGPVDPTSSARQHNVIVGGTGRYAGARGVEDFTFRSPDTAVETLRISR